MKLELFVNSIYNDDKTKQAEFVACRMRNTESKTIKIPVANFKSQALELPAQHDGVVVEITGKVKEGSTHVTVENCKILPATEDAMYAVGAGAPSVIEHDDADAYFSNLESTDVPFS
jgi:hypothetical protein